MNTSVLRAAISARSRTSADASTIAALRATLVVGSVVAAGIAWLATSGASRAAEPELALLLRGMAAIKGLLAASAAGLVWWRFGRPVSSRVAVTYIVCVSVLVVGTVLIWQLAFVPAAAILFHAGMLVGLVVAMREGHASPRSRPHAPASPHARR